MDGWDEDGRQEEKKGGEIGNEARVWRKEWSVGVRRPEEVKEGRVSNLRGEMNGKWSCRETGEENVMRRWLGGGKKDRRQMQRNARGSANEPYAWSTVLTPLSLPFFFFFHTDSIFLHIFSHTFFPSFSFHTGTCVQKNTLKLIHLQHKKAQTNTHIHAQNAHSHGWVNELKRVLITAAAASPFISL